MPLKRTASEREPQPPQEQEKAIPIAIQPRLEPGEAQAVEPGRPYQAFVDSEVRKYWEEIEERGRNLTKPSKEEVRAAAMPVLCLALRNRRGSRSSRRHQAVNAMQLHAVEGGWIKHPFTLSEASPNYVEALVQLADNACWLPQEVRLPLHPAPHHPPIYYTRDPGTGLPKPREDSLIRGDFVSGPTGRRLTRDDSLTRMDLEFGSACRRITGNEYIHPVFCPRGQRPHPDELVARGWDAAYMLVELFRGKPEVFIYWIVKLDSRSMVRGMPLSWLHFSRYPPRFFID